MTVRYYEKFSANKFENLKEMDNYLKIYKITHTFKLNLNRNANFIQEEIENVA